MPTPSPKATATSSKAPKRTDRRLVWRATQSGAGPESPAPPMRLRVSASGFFPEDAAELGGVVVANDADDLVLGHTENRELLRDQVPCQPLRKFPHHKLDRRAVF